TASLPRWCVPCDRLTTMQVKLPRRRWLLLLLVGIAGLASCFLWPKSVMREKYDRIRLGMTPAEIASCLGSAPSGEAFADKLLLSRGGWGSADYEEQEFDFSEVDETQLWVDESVTLAVCYSHGNAVKEGHGKLRAPWKVKARNWLAWLRGLVGW